MEGLFLKDFVNKYNLPQVVRVVDTDQLLENKSTFHADQILNLHSNKKISKVLCQDSNGASYYIPLLLQEKVLKRRRGCLVNTVAELYALQPEPNFVLVVNGYCIDGTNETSIFYIEKGDLLKVVIPHYEKLNNETHMRFATEQGEFELSFSCDVGFIPLYDTEENFLKKVLSTDQVGLLPDISIQFVRKDFYFHRLGVLHCKAIYEEKVITASSTENGLGYIYSIPQDLKLLVRVSKETNGADKINDNKIPRLEETLSDKTNKHVFSTFMEVFKFPYDSITEKKQTPIPKCPARSKPPIAPKPYINPQPVSRPRKPSTLPNNSKYDKLQHGTISRAMSVPAVPHKPYDYIDVKDIQSATRLEELEKKGLPRTQSSIKEREAFGEKPVNEMSLVQVCNMMRYLKLTHHVDTFKTNQIDGSLLCELSNEELKDVGLTAFEVKKILKYKEGWRPKLK